MAGDVARPEHRPQRRRELDASCSDEAAAVHVTSAGADATACATRSTRTEQLGLLRVGWHDANGCDQLWRAILR